MRGPPAVRRAQREQSGPGAASQWHLSGGGPAAGAGTRLPVRSGRLARATDVCLFVSMMTAGRRRWRLFMPRTADGGRRRSRRSRAAAAPAGRHDSSGWQGGCLLMGHRGRLCRRGRRDGWVAAGSRGGWPEVAPNRTGKGAGLLTTSGTRYPNSLLLGANTLLLICGNENGNDDIRRHVKSMEHLTFKANGSQIT